MKLINLEAETASIEEIPERYRQYFRKENDFLIINNVVLIPAYQVIENILISQELQRS